MAAEMFEARLPFVVDSVAAQWSCAGRQDARAPHADSRRGARLDIFRRRAHRRAFFELPVPRDHKLETHRLIGTIRREFLDHVLFWSVLDLEPKLGEFQRYFNGARVHASLGATPKELAGEAPRTPSPAK